MSEVPSTPASPQGPPAPAEDSGVFRIRARPQQEVPAQVVMPPAPPVAISNVGAPPLDRIDRPAEAGTRTTSTRQPEKHIELPAARQASVGLPVFAPVVPATIENEGPAVPAGKDVSATASAGARPTEGTRRISVSAKKLDCPPRCPCCLDRADAAYRAVHIRVRGTRITRTSSTTWEFPYCRRCLEHVAAARRIWKRFRLEVMLYPITAALAALFLVTVLWWLPFIGFAVGLAAAPAVLMFRLRRLRAAMPAACAAVGPAVEYTGFEGSIHHFRFAHSAYAEEFARANAKKLVE